MTKLITSHAMLAEELDTEATQEAMSKTVFKGTKCGAWLELMEGGIRLGSIIEGSDATVGPYEYKYGFTDDAFWRMLEMVDDEADQLWREANEPDEGPVIEVKFIGVDNASGALAEAAELAANLISTLGEDDA